MQIKSYLTNNKRKNFLISSNKDDLPIMRILKLINTNSLGFAILKINKKYKILTDGDFRRGIIREKNFLSKTSSYIKSKKIISIDFNETMYKAYRIMSNKQINCILVAKKKKNYILFNTTRN